MLEAHLAVERPAAENNSYQQFDHQQQSIHQQQSAAHQQLSGCQKSYGVLPFSEGQAILPQEASSMDKRKPLPVIPCVSSTKIMFLLNRDHRSFCRWGIYDYD